MTYQMHFIPGHEALDIILETGGKKDVLARLPYWIIEDLVSRLREKKADIVDAQRLIWTREKEEADARVNRAMTDSQTAQARLADLAEPPAA